MKREYWSVNVKKGVCVWVSEWVSECVCVCVCVCVKYIWCMRRIDKNDKDLPWSSSFNHPFLQLTVFQLGWNEEYDQMCRGIINIHEYICNWDSESERVREWESERVREWEWERERERECVCVTFSITYNKDWGKWQREVLIIEDPISSPTNIQAVGTEVYSCAV